MKVTVGIIAYNEEQNICILLDNLVKQTYSKQDTEIILVDSLSNDNTKQIMQNFANKYTDFWSVKVYDNPQKVQPAGWNVVIDNAKGDIVIRLDAHAIIPDDFIEQNVKCIESGEDVCGGRRDNIIMSDKLSHKILNIAENSLFGSGIADYRREVKKEYVKTIAHACYRKSVLDSVGRFDERLVRAEDNDFHYRIREAGYKICMSSEIHSEYLTRPTLIGMIKQKYGNGKYIGIGSMIKTPKMFSLYHFIPMFFVLGVILATAMFIPGIIFWSSLWWLCIPFLLGVGLYIILDILLTIKGSLDYKQPIGLITLPFLFPILHVSYGFGTLYGIIVSFFYK